MIYELNKVIKTLSSSNAAIKNTASEKPVEGWYPAYSASGQDVWLPDYRYDQKAIIVSAVGARCGKAYKADGKWNVCANTHSLSVDDTIADRDYCWYILNNENWWVKGGTAQPFVKVNDSLKRKHDFPEMSKQKAIVETLDKVRSVIDARQQELQKLDDLVKARFVEMFGRRQYEVVKAFEVCDFVTKGTTPPTGEITETFDNSKVPFLKVYNLSFTGEMLFDKNPQYIPKETHNGKLSRSKVFPNDVLMNIVGPPLGKFALVSDEYAEWNINQAIAIFRAKERILPRYLLQALMQPEVLKPFVDQAVGIRQQNLSLEQCRNLQFPLPPLEEQKQFVEFAEHLDKSKFVL